MSGRQATAVAILSMILAACSAGSQPTTPMLGSPDPSHGPPAQAGVSPTPTTLVATPTVVPTTTATPAATPEATPKAPDARVPPKPAGVKFRASMRCVNDACYRYKHIQTVTWKSPLTKGVEIRVYGVTECLALPARPKPGTDGPCLVKNTPLPASVRTLLARAPASAGKASWSWIAGDPGCDIWYPVGEPPDRPAYYAVVLAGYGTSGHSIFAIAEPGAWSEPDWESGDMIC